MVFGADEPYVSKEYAGYRETPLDWSQLATRVEAIFGPDVLELKRFPEIVGGTFATWHAEDGAWHTVTEIESLRDAYAAGLARVVQLHRDYGDLQTASLTYSVGDSFAMFKMTVRTSKAEGMLAAMKETFPLQPHITFVSWSGNQGLSVGKVMVELLRSRLPPRSEVFISSEIELGSDPYGVLLDRYLLPCDALVSVWTSEALSKPAWINWETATAWAKGRLVIPLFVGVNPEDVPGPVSFRRQGAKLDNRTDVDRLVSRLVVAAGEPEPEPLAEEEYHELLKLL